MAAIRCIWRNSGARRPQRLEPRRFQFLPDQWWRSLPDQRSANTGYAGHHGWRARCSYPRQRRWHRRAERGCDSGDSGAYRRLSAEYGDAAGGQIRIITKSGTTDFHGGLFEYFRNSALNANSWGRNLSKTTNFTSPFRYNNFGFDIGGPIWTPGLPKWMRQKMFFFVGEEWTRYRFADTQTQAVPTTLMRQGNFSELLAPNPWYKGVTQLYDPTSAQSVKNGVCTPKAGFAACVPIPTTTFWLTTRVC